MTPQSTHVFALPAAARQALEKQGAFRSEIDGIPYTADDQMQGTDSLQMGVTGICRKFDMDNEQDAAEYADIRTQVYMGNAELLWEERQPLSDGKLIVRIMYITAAYVTKNTNIRMDRYERLSENDAQGSRDAVVPVLDNAWAACQNPF